MSKDYIGPFGPESRTAATDVLHEQTNICAGADTCDSRTVADEVLSAAVSAIDREALLLRMQRATTDLQRRTVAGRIPSMQDVLRASIEALFPTEGEAGHGA